MFKNEGQKLFFFCLCPQSSYFVSFRADKVPFRIFPCFQGFVCKCWEKVGEEQRSANLFFLWLQKAFSPARTFGYADHIYMQPSLLQAGTRLRHPAKKQRSGSTDSLHPESSPEPHNHIGPIALPRQECVNTAGFCPFFTCSSPFTKQDSMIWASFPDSQDARTFLRAHIQRSGQHWTIQLSSFAPVSSPMKWQTVKFICMEKERKNFRFRDKVWYIWAVRYLSSNSHEKCCLVCCCHSCFYLPQRRLYLFPSFFFFSGTLFPFVILFPFKLV